MWNNHMQLRLQIAQVRETLHAAAVLIGPVPRETLT